MRERGLAVRGREASQVAGGRGSFVVNEMNRVAKANRVPSEKVNELHYARLCVSVSVSMCA